MDGTELFFSAAGRAPRLPSLIAAGALLGLAIAYEALIEDFWLHLLVGVIVYPVLFYCGACVLSKRLHDRGRSGWWAAPILVSIVALWPYPHHFVDFPFFLVVLWGVVELAILPGEQGANRYGMNPQRLAAA